MTARPPLLALREAQFGFGRAPLFEGISVSLGAGDRICLVGRNGCGKSTLLQLLTGALEIDSGDRFVQPGCRIAHLAQEPVFRPDATVAELIEDVAPARHRVDAMLAHYGLDGEAPADGLSICWSSTNPRTISTCRRSNSSRRTSPLLGGRC